jgi:hypothetical protein
MNIKKDLLMLEAILMVAVRSFEFTFDTFIVDKLDVIANNYEQIYIAALFNHLLFVLEFL